jgi:hypothetical protein
MKLLNMIDKAFENTPFLIVETVFLIRITEIENYAKYGDSGLTYAGTLKKRFTRQYVLNYVNHQQNNTNKRIQMLCNILRPVVDRRAKLDSILKDL